MRQAPANPWTDVSAWKEFKYDMRHPLQMMRRGNAAATDPDSEIAPLLRVMFAVAATVWACNLVVGTAATAYFLFG